LGKIYLLFWVKLVIVFKTFLASIVIQLPTFKCSSTECCPRTGDGVLTACKKIIQKKEKRINYHHQRAKEK